MVGYHVKIDEAQSHGRTIFEYAPSDRGAKAMAALAEELDARGAELVLESSPSVSKPGDSAAEPARSVVDGR